MCHKSGWRAAGKMHLRVCALAEKIVGRCAVCAVQHCFCVYWALITSKAQHLRKTYRVRLRLFNGTAALLPKSCSSRWRHAKQWRCCWCQQTPGYSARLPSIYNCNIIFHYLISNLNQFFLLSFCTNLFNLTYYLSSFKIGWINFFHFSWEHFNLKLFGCSF